jgi:hypothetical protein
MKSLLAAALLTTVFATGALAATPATNAPGTVKPVAPLVHKIAMKKMGMMHHCAKGMHMVKGKCAK